MAYRFRVLDNNSNQAALGAVSDFDPVSGETGFWGEVDADGCNGLGGGVTVKFGDEEVIVFHAEGEFLHVDVADGAGGAAEEEKRAGGVQGGDGAEGLEENGLGEGVPDANSTGSGEGY